MTTPLLVVENLHAKAEGAEILKGVSLTINHGELHAVMGPNGAGKSTLASVLMGNPAYTVTAGSVHLNGTDITAMAPDERARLGVFLAFQYPESISGVSVTQFLRQAISARTGLEDLSVLEVRLNMSEWMERLGMDPAFAERHLNEGFSGGERKRNEVLQMALLEPELAILDETDSGLDIDALKVVAAGVQAVSAERPQMGSLVITHYQKLLDQLVPQAVHILVDGKIVHRGDASLVKQIERDGYDHWRDDS